MITVSRIFLFLMGCCWIKDAVLLWKRNSQTFFQLYTAVWILFIHFSIINLLGVQLGFKKSTVKLDTVCNFLFFTHQLICQKKQKKQQNYVTFENWIFVPKKWNFPMIWIQSHRIKKHQFQYVIVTCKFDIIDIFLQVRQVEYKDKLDDEWEMFQRAIKEENHVSYSNHTSLASI